MLLVSPRPVLEGRGRVRSRLAAFAGARGVRPSLQSRSASASPRSCSSTTPAGRSSSPRSRPPGRNPSAVGRSRPADHLAGRAGGAYLAATNARRGDLGRLSGSGRSTEAWLARWRRPARRGRRPGEVDSGIGRFLRGLAAGPGELALPVVDGVDRGTRTGHRPRGHGRPLRELVPFPTRRSRGRVRVRLLDGAGDPKHVQSVAPLVIPADAEIVVVGNADAFDYQETEIRYHTPDLRGGGPGPAGRPRRWRVVDDPRQTGTFDVTIVLGTDV